MKIAYFDCSSGIAGNMILGALIDAGLDVNHLKKELRKLKLPNYTLQAKKIKRGLIDGTFLEVKIKEEKNRRRLKDILGIIKKSKLSKNVKNLSCRIFKRLAEAEAKVHGEPISKIHFHEVGAVDALVDIVGAAIGIEKLGIDKSYCSPLPFSQGKIKHAHGILPVPAPATAELLKNIPTYGIDVRGELVTPTGAAIISTLASAFGDIPRIKVENIGYGAGSLTLPSLSNFLRIFIGEAQIPSERDAVLQIETNLDDMRPEKYPKIIAKLMKAGALDAYIIPILMKKERQAVALVVLCAPEMRDKILNQFFTLTTSFGVRIYLAPREKLSRKSIKIKTKYGKAKIKLGFLGKELKTIAPEYEDYKRLAKKHHIPLRQAYQETLKCLSTPTPI